MTEAVTSGIDRLLLMFASPGVARLLVLGPLCKRTIAARVELLDHPHLHHAVREDLVAVDHPLETLLCLLARGRAVAGAGLNCMLLPFVGCIVFYSC